MQCFGCGQKPKKAKEEVVKNYNQMDDEEKVAYLQSQIEMARSKVVKGEADQRALDELTEDAIVRKFKAMESKEADSYIEQLMQRVNEYIRKRLLCKDDLRYYRNQKIVYEDLEIALRRKIEQQKMNHVTQGAERDMKEIVELEKQVAEGIQRVRQQQEEYEIARKQNPLNDPNGIYSEQTKKEIAEMEASYVKRYNEKNAQSQPIGAITGD